MTLPDIINGIKEIALSVDIYISSSINLIAGSLLALFSTSFNRPSNSKIKYTYLLYLPGWYCIIHTIYFAQVIKQTALIIYINQQRANDILLKINENYENMLYYFNGSLICFAIWLVIYLIWFVFTSFKPGYNKLIFLGALLIGNLNYSFSQSNDCDCLSYPPSTECLLFCADTTLKLNNTIDSITKSKIFLKIDDVKLFITNKKQHINQQLYKLELSKRQTIDRCRIISKQKTKCLSDVDSLNSVYERNYNQFKLKFSYDTLDITNICQKYINKKWSLLKPFQTKRRRIKDINKCLSPYSISLKTGFKESYNIISNNYRFSCSLSENCNSSLCPSIENYSNQNCLCIPVCPKPDSTCQKFIYLESECSCFCEKCLSTSNGIERYWDNELKLCLEKEINFQVVVYDSKREADSILNLIKKVVSKPTSCLVTVESYNGKDLLFTVGNDINDKIQCSSYLRQYNYPDGDYNINSNLIERIDTLLNLIKGHIDGDYKIIIKIVGTADNKNCCFEKDNFGKNIRKVYHDSSIIIKKYYLIDEENNCREKKELELVQNKTFLNNENLGILRAYQLKKYVDNYFPNNTTTKLYTLPWVSHRGGGYKRVEIYLLVKDFQNKFYKRIIDTEQNKYKNEFKECNPCDSYYLLDNCKNENK
jgi:hypothetical protein